MKRSFMQIVIMMSLIMMTCGCFEDPRVKALGLDYLPKNGHRGSISSVRNVSDDTVEMEFEFIPKGYKFELTVKKSENSAIFADLHASTSYADSGTGAGFIIVDQKHRNLMLVWMESVLVPTFIGKVDNGIDISAGTNVDGSVADFYYQFSGVKFSMVTGLYSIGDIQLPSWMYQAKLDGK